MSGAEHAMHGQPGSSDASLLMLYLRVVCRGGAPAGGCAAVQRHDGGRHRAAVGAAALQPALGAHAPIRGCAAREHVVP